MAAAQNGTGSLTLAGQAAAAATYITVPSGAIIESITINSGGAPQYDDVMDEDGAFHTRITYVKIMHTATIVIVGKAYASAAGAVDGSSANYYVESVAAEYSKGPIRTTVTVTRLPTIA